MHLSPRINWSLIGLRSQDIDPGLFLLLKAIQEQGSLQKSSLSLEMSYRHAWGLIKKWESELNSPLVIFRRGRGQGARLTELGEKLLWADEYLETQIRPNLDSINETLNESLADYLQKGQRKKINMFASHGLAIKHLFKLLELEPTLEIELQTLGSLDSLQNLHNGHCQIAGFHLPMELIHDEVLPLFKRWLSPEQKLLTVSTREQGLIVRRGNPKKIRLLKDLTRRSTRFINRQPNSGTRIIVDKLLKAEKIKSKQINGYKNEEFTHAAVAAMIASGAADTGFGIKAIAQQFNLDFVPFLRETYLLAIDEKLDSRTVKKIVSLLKSAEFRGPVNKLAGYDARQSGKPFTLQW
jgi:putative molybdopterin biosynthesis protein